MAQILSAGSSGGITQAYTTIQEAGSSLAQRSLLNVVGSALIATDDSGGSRTQLTAATALNSIASGTWTGASSITTLGTIATGTWNGTDITVPYGGTGLTSTTAYAVLCGGTTSTAALQPVASVGTSGYVLTSNGAGALPTFQAAGGGGAITSVVQQIFTTSGTYTPTSGMVYAYVEVLGGGSGGAGTTSPGLNFVNVGGGGGAGGYAASLLSAATIGASQTVTVGAAGAPDGVGGTSSFGSLVTGLHAYYAVETQTSSLAMAFGYTLSGYSIGGGGSGSLVIPGGNGGSGYGFSLGAYGVMGLGGEGGRSHLGTGTFSEGVLAAGVRTGNTATSYGDGGTGSLSVSDASTNAGGANGGSGYQGIVIVTEYVG